ncbi:DSBA oxidoreductase [Pseudonocardia sulfidoxydans NBRC 16205]|uniref:DSBA oxidoreductase n=1 Tax=Pseudonocardia sulfidoxydans NBRC 16205 TaxID=1223511 RepID=A0A511DKF6_9PSEU|nr:DsbA family protein [Pseudonocardia sulfidoxydans]GEL25301.1 DSBA oxidoreductase [Pseudonocardia sulfidoxydans NBRC 16205]
MTSASISQPTAVDFFFDPGCPFTWRTSRWITEVADAGAATVTWRLMSLSVLNEGKDVPEQYRPLMVQSARVLRVLAAVEDNDARGRLFTALGVRRHDNGEDWDDTLLAAAIAEAGLLATLIDAADDAGLDATVKASHEESQTAVGEESGSPVLRLGATAWFGPVVVPVPTGDEALRLFEAVRLLADVPSFSELKGSRNPF